MIRLDLAGLIIVYLLVFLAAIFVVWISYEMVRRFRDTHAQRYRVKCAICGMEYEDRTTALLPRCPSCGSFNERNKLKGY